MGILNDDDKKAFFTVLEEYQASNLSNKRGSCFKMKMLGDSDQLFWVSSSSVFTDPQQGQGNTFVAQRSLAKTKAGIEKLVAVREELDVANLNSKGPKGGVCFIKCSAESISKAKKKYYLTYGEHGNGPPKEVVAFVFDGNNILELKFQKTDDGIYKMDNIANVSDNFELRKAVGAPIIFGVSSPGRNQVVGVLDRKSDGSCVPVFFNETTFVIDPTRIKSSSESSNKADLKADETTPQQNIGEVKVQVNGKGEPSGLNASSDKTDSPTVPIQESPTESRSDGPRADDKKQPIHVHVGRTTAQKEKPIGSTGESSSLLLPASQCRKLQTLGEAPNTRKLFQNLKVRLDPERLFGNDYKSLADLFGCTNNQIDYLSTKDSPTEQLLRQESNRTILDLRDKLVSMERHDAVEDIDKYIENQGCNCENCGELPLDKSNDDVDNGIPKEQVVDDEVAAHLPRLGNIQDTGGSSSAKPNNEEKKDMQVEGGDIPLEELWENIYFRDEFCRALDTDHSIAFGVQNWGHLAQQFGEGTQNFPSSPDSPTEALLTYLHSTKPDLTVRDLCVALKEAKANQVLRLLETSTGIEEKQLTYDDLVSQMCDSASDILNEFILKLDKGNLWEAVASKLEIPEKKYSVFTRDPKCKPTRTLFDILRTYSPSLEVRLKYVKAWVF